ncbi:MAG: glycosyltransferase [Gemmatimonadetes bacterium]|nr:glycosyltransferase [Gemmatimonadota bacterium]
MDLSAPRVALLIGQLGAGGAERQLCLLARSLLRTRYQPFVVALKAGGALEADLRAAGVETYALRRRHSVDPLRLWSLARILRRRRPLVAHGFDPAGSQYAKLAALITDVPFVIGGTQAMFSQPWRVRMLERVLRHRTDAVITNSEAAKRRWTRSTGYPPERIAVVPNGVDFREMERVPAGFTPLRELLGIPPHEPVVGCLASIYHEKNPGMFVEAAAAVNRADVCARFVWIGDGPLRADMEAAIRRHNLGARVHVLGWRADGRWLARDFDVGVLTSISESLPNSVLEYMYWGVPVVVTDAGGLVELVEHGKSGLVVAKNDAAAMTRAILALLVDPPWARSLGRGGRERILQRHSAEQTAARTIEVYERVIMGRKPGSDASGAGRMAGSSASSGTT